MADSTQEYIEYIRNLASKLDQEKMTEVVEYISSNGEKIPNFAYYDRLLEEDFLKYGQLYAIRYEDIVGPFYRISEGETLSGYFRECEDSISLNGVDILGDVAKLWTILRYDGNGQLYDTISERYLSVPISEFHVSSDIDGKTQEKMSRLVANPLGIRGVEVTNSVGEPITKNVPFVESASKVQETFLRDTLPRKQEIIERLDMLEAKAKKGLFDFLGISNPEYYEEMAKFYKRENSIEESDLESALIDEDVIETTSRHR